MAKVAIYKRPQDPLAEPDVVVIYLVRHGEAEDHGNGEPADPPLTRRGRRQAARLGRRLSRVRFNHVYLSELSRAHETGEIILKRHPRTPVTVSGDLREVGSHHYQGALEAAAGVAALPDPERTALEAFVAHVRAVHLPGDCILVVAHGNLIRALVPLFAGQEPSRGLILDVSNTGLTVLECWPKGRVVLRRANCTRHLAERDIT